MRDADGTRDGESVENDEDRCRAVVPIILAVGDAVGGRLSRRGRVTQQRRPVSLTGDGPSGVGRVVLA